MRLKKIFPSRILHGGSYPELVEVRAKLAEEFCKELGSTNVVMGSLTRQLCPIQD